MVDRLIVSADDYAMSAAIDAGILSLIEMGRVTATSCMTLSPRWPEAARHITGKILDMADIGLHLDFTEHPQPLRRQLPLMMTRTFIRSMDRQAIKDSICRQLDCFEDALGKAPDYIDGHQHVHQLPQIRDALLDALAQRYAENLPWIRISSPPLQDGLKGVAIALLGAKKLARKAARAGFFCNETLLGIYAFEGNAADYQKKLSGWLDLAHRSSSDSGMAVLMCHPALPGTVSKADNDPIFQARLNEYAVLASENFPVLLKQYSLELTRRKNLRFS